MSRTDSATGAGTSYAPSRTQRTNRKAIWSLVLSILTLGGLGSIAGIWLGAVARREILGSRERGAGLAVAGIIVGVITLLVAIAYWVLIAVHMGSAGSGGGGGGGGGGY